MQYLCDHLWHLSLFPPLSPSKYFLIFTKALKVAKHQQNHPMVDQHCHLGTSPCPFVLGKKGGRRWHGMDACMPYLLSLSYLAPPMSFTGLRPFCTPTLPQQHSYLTCQAPWLAPNSLSRWFALDRHGYGYFSKLTPLTEPSRH
jgi:hypothetical protein